MLYSEIIAVCSQIQTKHINTLCGQNVELLNVKLVVHIVTTGLWRVKWLAEASSDWCPAVPSSDWCPAVPSSDWWPTVPSSDWCPAVPSSDWCPAVPGSDCCPAVPSSDRCPTVPHKDSAQFKGTVLNEQIAVCRFGRGLYSVYWQCSVNADM